MDAQPPAPQVADKIRLTAHRNRHLRTAVEEKAGTPDPESSPLRRSILPFSSLTWPRGRPTFPPLIYFATMANSKSALKYIRKTETRTQQNRQVKSRLKTLSKKVDSAAADGDKDALASASKEYISALDKAGKGGLVHANKIARHKARCAKLA